MPSRTKEEYYQSALKQREIVKDPAVMACTCPDTLCQWHGKCAECVALHRHFDNHIPACLQPMLTEKVRAIAGVVELLTQKKPGTPRELRLYMHERDGGADPHD